MVFRLSLSLLRVWIQDGAPFIKLCSFAKIHLLCRLQNSKACWGTKIRLCVTLSVTPSRLGSANRYSVYVQWDVLPKFPERIAKEHGPQKSKGLLNFSYLPIFADSFQMRFAALHWFHARTLTTALLCCLFPCVIHHGFLSVLVSKLN